MTATPLLYEAAFRLPADRAWELLRDPVAMSRAAMHSVVGPNRDLTRVEANLLWRADPRRTVVRAAALDPGDLEAAVRYVGDTALATFDA